MDYQQEEETGNGGRWQPYGNGGRMPKIRHQLGKITEAEILAVLHLKYPWVKVQMRLTRTGNALLFPKDNRSQKLLMEVKSINGKECSLQPAETTFRKTYIMMGVPQGAITKTSAIKTAIVQDDLDIVMIQDTRYKHRLVIFLI